MKTRISITILAVILAAGTALKAQNNPEEYLGLPGDNLNLYAVMTLFQQAKTLEAFERNLNDPGNRVNNLDLNGDNLVDYIMVYDNEDGGIHYIILRDAISRNESQDVAVFTVQRFNNGQVYVQLTGDEALYGQNYIIEPASQVVLNSWPLIRYIYRPNYIVWQSDWYWDFYPSYWTPWRPSYWHYYYGYHYNNWHNDYYIRYHRSYAHRDDHWNDHYYAGHRVSSTAVNRNVHTGNYRSTYSHPEKRNEGEAVYRNSHPEQGRRNTYSTTTGSYNNRNNYPTGNERKTSGNVTSSRRTEEPVNSIRSNEYRTRQGQNQSGNTASTSTRSTVSNSGAERNSVSQERESIRYPVRQESKPEKSQSSSSVRSSENSRSESGSVSRRSSESEKQVNNNESKEKSGKTETTVTSRRR